MHPVIIIIIIIITIIVIGSVVVIVVTIEAFLPLQQLLQNIYIPIK